MPGKRTKAKRLVISLFSGAMGLDLGLERAGLEVVVAVECNPHAIATIKANRPDLSLIERRIETVTTAEILKVAGLKAGEAFAVCAGPSCQVFSTAGKRGSLADSRGTMFEQFIRIVREARPRFFVLENVRGLLSAAIKHRPLRERGPGYPRLKGEEELGSAFGVVSEQLRKLGYYCIFDVLNAADFGVPQERHRLVVIGTRDRELIAMPAPTHCRNGEAGLLSWTTLGTALADLRDDQNREFYRFCPTKEKYLALVPEGGNWRDLPRRMQRKALGKAYVSWGGRSGFFRRLSFDRPSPALTTRPDSKATTLCHPTELRPLAVAEYSRIQQFPADWQFSGSVRKKYEQVGNAVPLGLGEAIGRALLKAARSRRLAGRKGRVECFNLDLLESLCKRPKTVVNPPRMRNDTLKKTITKWYNGAKRNRDDAFAYVPPQLLKAFRARLGKRWPSLPAKGIKRQSPQRRTRLRKTHHRAARRGVWLTAAE
jgi:DNA (cytosine-5)-methyltransferase 1